MKLTFLTTAILLPLAVLGQSKSQTYKVISDTAANGKGQSITTLLDLFQVAVREPEVSVDWIPDITRNLDILRDRIREGSQKLYGLTPITDDKESKTANEWTQDFSDDFVKLLQFFGRVAPSFGSKGLSIIRPLDDVRKAIATFYKIVLVKNPKQSRYIWQQDQNIAQAANSAGLVILRNEGVLNALRK